MTPDERILLTDAVTQLKRSIAYRTGATNVRQPTLRIADLIARSTQSTTPPVPTRPVRKKGAIVVNAGNCDPNLLRQAGITHVAAEVNQPNMADFATARWQGFTRGAFYVARGVTVSDAQQDAVIAASWTAAHKLTLLVVDTEAHKADMGGNLELTEAIFPTLRNELGPAFPLYNITFGVHSSPAVVNHAAFRKHNIVPIWEAYQGGSPGIPDGSTLGVARTVAKANAEGWSPAHVCIGDKNIAQDVAEMRALSGLGDVWCWSPEQSGATVLELAKVPV